MAEFCTNCALELGFCKPDFDIEEIASELEPGFQIGPYLCEGCGLSSIGKNNKGEIMVMVEDEDGMGKWIPFVRGEGDFFDCDEHNHIDFEF